MPERPPRPAPEASRGIRAAPEILWSPLASAAVVAVPGIAALATGSPMLFPSLAPTAMLQASHPQLPSARPYGVLVGHAAAIVASYAVVLAMGVAAEPSPFQAHSLTPGRFWASIVALALTKLLMVIFRAAHPPAGATTFLIALGGFRPLWSDVAALSFGVLAVAVAGELARQARLWQPGQR